MGGHKYFSSAFFIIFTRFVCCYGSFLSVDILVVVIAIVIVYCCLSIVRMVVSVVCWIDFSKKLPVPPLSTMVPRHSHPEQATLSDRRERPSRPRSRDGYSFSSAGGFRLWLL